MKIQVQNEMGQELAKAEGEERVSLFFEGAYQEGMHIVVSGLSPEHFYVFSPDAAIAPSLVFVRAEAFTYEIPFGEKKTGIAENAFSGNRHLAAIRTAEAFEWSGIRNLALNPADQHGEVKVYPHATANVETRGEAVFAARNAIDGVICQNSHGEWPFESWGINRDPNAELTVDFGRMVDICEIRLYTRADFPHDNWWIQGTLSFSSGASMTFPMDKKTDTPHVLQFGTNEAPGLSGISWLKLGKLIPSQDPSPFPALTQIEVMGREHRPL
ncbi:MAG: carbohydrate-binding protein [Lachnospiraceae bacterium]|nr:carbohydrate-binding protein [Lachnospiraceae bacterium]